MSTKKICLKCGIKNAMKNFDTCFDFYINKEVNNKIRITEERNLIKDLID